MVRLFANKHGESSATLRLYLNKCFIQRPTASEMRCVALLITQKRVSDSLSIGVALKPGVPATLRVFASVRCAGKPLSEPTGVAVVNVRYRLFSFRLRSLVRAEVCVHFQSRV